MINAYTVVVANLKTGVIQGELPVWSAKLTSTLNQAGSLTCDMSLRPTRTSAVATLTKSSIAPRRNAVFLLRDDTVLGSGIIETYDMDVKGNSVSLVCPGWHWYFRHRYLKADLHQVAVDQTTIAKNLIDWAQSRSGGDVGVNTSTVVPTGVMRDRREWFGWSRLNIGELVEQLAAVQNGFHFRYRSRRSGSTFVTDFITSYPATGRPTSYVLDLGANVELLGLSGSGAEMSNNAESVGAGQGAAAPIVVAVSAASLDSMPLWETVDRFSDVSEVATLGEKSQRRLARGVEPIEIPKLRIGTDVEPEIGTYEVGDQVRVRGEYGLLSLDAFYVITQTDLNVTTSAQYVDLTVAPVEAFT